MSAMEKVAWTELLVSLLTVVVVTCLVPWLGFGATGAFALLGLLPISGFFLWRRGRSIVVDERDREIEKTALRVGVSVAWMALFMALIAISTWAGFFNNHEVPTKFLTWLIWIQFAICYGVKGFVAVAAYRRQQNAT